MGRAINKTVTIVELIKVILRFVMSNSQNVVQLMGYLKMFFSICNAEKDPWSSPEHIYWIHRHNRHMGTNWGRPSTVSGWKKLLYKLILNMIYCFMFCQLNKLLLISFLFLLSWSLETTRHVSMITIILSKNELNTSSVGWVRVLFLVLIFFCVVLSHN